MKKIYWFLFFTFLIICIVVAQDKPVLQPPIPSQVSPEAPRIIDTTGLKPAPSVSPSQEEKKSLTIPQLENIPSVSPSQERRGQPEKTGLNQLSDVQVSTDLSYKVQNFRDFRGGLNYSTYKTKLAPNDADTLVNALWNPMGELYKRNGYTVCDPSITNINFIYRYYKQQADTNGCDKYEIIGNDTALFYAKMDSCSYTYLIGTGGVTGRWDGTTFDDYFVATHEGFRAIKWNGDTLSYIGETSYLYDSTWADDCTLWIHIDDAGFTPDDLVDLWVYQETPSFQSGGISYGQVVDNTEDKIGIKYNASSGTNLWTPDLRVVLASALTDSIWVGGVIDTFWGATSQQEILVPIKDTLVNQWTAIPADSHYKVVNDTIEPYYDDVYPTAYLSFINDGIWTNTAGNKDIFKVNANTSGITTIKKVRLLVAGLSLNAFEKAYVECAICLKDTTRCQTTKFRLDPGWDGTNWWAYIYSTSWYANPDGDPWDTADFDTDSLLISAKYETSSGTPYIEAMWLMVYYEEENVDCGFAVFDSSLFDTLLVNQIPVLTYFEWIPQNYPDTGVAGREYRNILTQGQGIVDNHYYLIIAKPQIPDLAVGDSFNLRTLYPPMPKYCETYQEQLFLAWSGTGAEQNKNIIYWSEPNNLGFFKDDKYIIIESPYGDFITGMASFSGSYVDVPRDELIVGQNSALFKVVPDATSPGYYNIWTISTGVGVASNNTMSSIEGKMMVFADQHGVDVYDRQSVQKISQKIDPIVQAWDTDSLEWMSAVYNPDDRHYYISLPERVDTTLILPSDTNVYAVICWWDDMGVQWDIRAQKFDFDMTKIDTVFTVNNDTVGDQETPDIAYAQVGRWVFTWTDQYGDTVEKDIALRRFDSDFQPLDTSIVISDSRVNTRTSAHIDCNSDGKCVVVWEDRRDSVTLPSIYGQRIDSSGNAIGSNFSILASTYPYYVPHIAIGDDGKFVVAWMTWKYLGNTDTVYFQRYDSAGSEIGSKVVVNTSTNMGSSCDIALKDGTNEFMIIWNKDASPNKDIYGRWYDSSGTPITDVINIDDDALSKNQEYVSCAVNDSGNYITAWDDYRLTTWSNIYAQRFTDTTHVGSNFRTTNNDDEYKYSAVAIDEDGNFIVIGTDVNGAIEYGVWFSRYNSSGTKTDSGWASDLLFQPDENAVAINPFYTETTLSIDTVLGETYAWSFDFQGWAQESFGASAYCYQHSPFDSTKILFAQNDTICYYGESETDNGNPVILTYQSPYLTFSQYPSFYNILRYVNFECYGDGGQVNVDFYKEYSDLAYTDSIDCATGDCREEIDLPDSLMGHNLSIKIRTGTGWHNFILSQYWWEYQEIQRRRK